MYNKYHGTNPALTNKQDLYGREYAFQLLDDHIKNRRSVVIMGVEGVGKSSLLNCYFNVAYRRKMARDQRILIRVTDFPTDRDTDGVYQYLAEGVLYAIDSLDQDETEIIYKKIREKCLAKMHECKDSASRFQQVCETIQEFEYNITLVIDGFERFVSSPYVKMEHHDLMNNLIAKNLSFVVSTNYDFNQDSLPATVSGSFLLMKFSGNEIRLKGLSEKEAVNLMYPEDFTEEELHQLWILSGGIPAVFRRAAEHTYAQKINGSIIWKEVFEETYADLFAQLVRWCKLLSTDQVRVLKAIANSDSPVGMSFEEDSLKSAAQVLVNRGILSNPVESGSFRSIPGLFKFSTPLLKRYCKDQDLHSETISINGRSEIEDNDLVKEYSAWAGVNELSINDPLPNSLLGQYQLSIESFSSYAESVQRFIRTGIIVDQALLGVDLFDHSPQFIEFAKALEAHLNLTLLPVLQLIDSGYVIKRGTDSNKDIILGNVDHLMLGQFVTILNSKYRFVPFTEKAGQFCSSKMNSFPRSWWEKLKREMSDIGTLPTRRESAADIRNGIAHVEFVTAEQGEALLRMMFLGEKSLFNRCQDLHNSATKQRLLSQRS